MSSDAVNALKRAKIFNAFHHRYYTTFLVSSSLMGFETLMFYLVLSWHVLELTNSPFLLMVVTASKYVATLLFGGVAGVITDRVGNRNVIIAIQMTNMVLMFMMAILIQTGMIQYWHIIVIVALWGIGGLAFGGAKQAIIHDIVGKRDLTNAMGLQMIIHTPISAFGSVVGGALIGLIGYSSCYYFLGATCGAAALLLSTIRVEETLTARKESMLRNLVDGLKYIRSSQAILVIILVEALYNLLVLPTVTGGMIAVYARNVLVVGAAELGILTGISGIGGLVASIFIASFGDFKHKGWLYVSVAVTQGITLFLFSMSRSYPLCLILMIYYGFTNSAYNTLANSLAMLNTSDEVRGRVMGVKYEAIGTLVFGNLYSGALAGSAGSPFAIGLGGGLYALSLLAIIAVAPKVRKLE